MSLAELFADALSAEATPDAVPELLPQRLARAVATVLPADGAGIGLRIEPGRQFPLGASDRDSGLAERLQFTIGAGPCLQASRTRQPVFVVEEDMRRRWPAFHDLLRVRTPYRGIVALPLRRGLEGAGAIDLYFREPADVAGLDVFAAMTVGDLATTSLAEAAVWSSCTETEGPAWLHSPAAEHRARVWQAMALIGVALERRPTRRSRCSAPRPTPRTGPRTTWPTTWSAVAPTPPRSSAAVPARRRRPGAGDRQQGTSTAISGPSSASTSGRSSPDQKLPGS